MSKRLTVAQVSEKLDVPNEIARGLIGLLVEKNIVQHVGMKPLSVGRAANVYEFRDGFENQILEILRAAKLAG